MRCGILQKLHDLSLMDSPKRAVIQQFVGEIVANLKLDQFAATFGADDSTRARFSDFPSFRAFCHVVLFPLFYFTLARLTVCLGAFSFAGDNNFSKFPDSFGRISFGFGACFVHTPNMQSAWNMSTIIF
jgi:hypothetical protein